MGEVVLVNTSPSDESEHSFDVHGAIFSEKVVRGSFNGSSSLPLAISVLME